MTQKIIFDCDNTLGLPIKEVDDGLALLYLLGVPEIKIQGITTSFGNGSIDQVLKQTQNLVSRLKVDLPVLKGEGYPGQDPDTPAARFLVERVNSCPYEITLLVTGPAGNLYAAQKLEPDFYTKVKQVVVMGGYLKPLKIGYRDLHELNFSANPDAVYNLLHAPCPVTIFPGHACLDAPYYAKDILTADYWPCWLRFVLIQWLVTFGLYCGVTKIYLWDLLPAVYLTNPEIFNEQPFSISSSLEDLQHGMIKADQIKQGSMQAIASGISNQKAFFTNLEVAWQQTSLKYPF
jgi:inosine-uridine nucleoside N-ribohydrolase